MTSTTETQCPTLLRKVAMVLLCATLHRHLRHTPALGTHVVGHWIGEVLRRLIRHAWDTVELPYLRAHTGNNKRWIGILRPGRRTTSQPFSTCRCIEELPVCRWTSLTAICIRLAGHSDPYPELVWGQRYWWLVIIFTVYSQMMWPRCVYTMKATWRVDTSHASAFFVYVNAINWHQKARSVTTANNVASSGRSSPWCHQIMSSGDDMQWTELRSMRKFNET